MRLLANWIVWLGIVVDLQFVIRVIRPNDVTAHLSIGSTHQGEYAVRCIVPTANWSYYMTDDPLAPQYCSDWSQCDAWPICLLASGPHVLWRWVRKSSIQKSFTWSATDWKSMKKSISYQICTYRFIAYYPTWYVNFTSFCPRSIWEILTFSSPGGECRQVSRSDTTPVLRLYLFPVRIRDIKCLNLDFCPVLRLSQCAAATVACHCLHYYCRISIAPSPSLYKCINNYSYKEGAGRWKHDNN